MPGYFFFDFGADFALALPFIAALRSSVTLRVFNRAAPRVLRVPSGWAFARRRLIRATRRATIGERKFVSGSCPRQLLALK